MANNHTGTPRSLPVANYSPAIARAVDWLGDRYLLAQPINAARKRHTGRQSSVGMEPPRSS
jgi:hypothetical protein